MKKRKRAFGEATHPTYATLAGLADLESANDLDDWREICAQNARLRAAGRE